MYDSILDLLLGIFGNSAVYGTVPYTVCQVLSCCACVFMVAVPFLIVWKVIQTIVNIGS